MAWIALFTCRRVTQPDDCPDKQNRGRHRRGEIISIKQVDAVPGGGFKYTHSQFTYIFVTDIPDDISKDELEEQFLRPHWDDTDPDNPIWYGRKFWFISLKTMPPPRLRRAWDDQHAQYQGWDDVIWPVFNNSWFKKRPPNTVPQGRGNPADDDADDTSGIQEAVDKRPTVLTGNGRNR